MKRYSYTDVLEIRKMGIYFSDGSLINFLECVEIFSDSYNISPGISKCVAYRDITSKPPSITFYDKNKTKIDFNRYKWRKRKNRIDFSNFITILKFYGFTTYDMS